MNLETGQKGVLLASTVTGQILDRKKVSEKEIIEIEGIKSSGVYFFSLNIDSFSTGQTFITTASPPFANPVYVGGTLTVGNSSASPPGQYNETFTLTFIQQ